MEAYNEEVQAMMPGTVWASGCASWYLDATGNNATMWPDYTFRFRQRTRHFDPDAYELRVGAPARRHEAVGVMRLPFARPDYDVAGRTVFVTGAARGIGAAIATRLHAAGANVALVGLEPELLEELAATLGDRAAAFEADVTDFEALQRAVRGTVERFGGIDVGIANAGISYIGRLATAPMQQVERALEVNLMGVWRTDRALIEQITARRGYLLNIASLAAASHTPLMGPVLGVEGRRRGADGQPARRDGADRRARRLRVLRLHRHRPRAHELRPPVVADPHGDAAEVRLDAGAARRTRSTRSRRGSGGGRRACGRRATSAARSSCAASSSR